MKEGNELVSTTKLSLWLKHDQNVLFEGLHGVGKTAIVLEAFRKAGLKYAYFSGSTMDPFIDFIGVPMKITTKSGGSAIELVRPKHMPKDIEAIFIDEFNRTHKKVRNAVMELIQFKTINGKAVFPDLRVIWAAVNPDNAQGDNDYDTDRLDPAQRDRFQVHATIPYRCDLKYFTTKFGSKQGRRAIKWWNSLDEKIRLDVSPRRLDYALSMLKTKGDVRDTLPPASNPARLIKMLKHEGGDLNDLIKKNAEPEEIKKFLENENNCDLYQDEIVKVSKYNGLFKYLPPEKKAALIGNKSLKSKVVRIVEKDLKKKELRHSYEELLFNMDRASQSKTLARWAKKLVNKYKMGRDKYEDEEYSPRRVKQQQSSKDAIIDLFHNNIGTEFSIQELKTSLQNIKHKIYSDRKVKNLLKKVKEWAEKEDGGLIEVSGGSYRVDLP